MRSHNREPRVFELFVRNLQPSADECCVMSCDLHDKLGSWKTFEAITGIPRRTVGAWLSGYRAPTAAACKAVFLLWCMFCRPGELQTAFDVATCGRFTKRGNPATAGGKLKKNLRKYHQHT